MRRSSDRSPSERALDVGERRASRIRKWLGDAAALGKSGLGEAHETKRGGAYRGELATERRRRTEICWIRTIQWSESGPVTN